jgi:hypothetical protein
MAVPISQMWAVASYVLKQRVARRERYATVLMLEPLLKCNLACAGCGKIQYRREALQHAGQLAHDLRQHLAAVAVAQGPRHRHGGIGHEVVLVDDRAAREQRVEG